MDSGQKPRNPSFLKEINLQEEFRNMAEKVDTKKEKKDEDAKYECGSCGHKFNEKVKYCPSCGAEFA